MKIYIGADHAGFDLKEKLKNFLQEQGHEVKDFGAFELNEEDDYPDFIIPVAKAVALDLSNGSDSRGIILGGSGQGEAICANKTPNIRAALFYGGNEEIVKLSRTHNDSNVLSLGARFINFDEAKNAVQIWLDTPFSGEERHDRRNKRCG